MKEAHYITDMCHVLGVGHTSFYDWRSRPADFEEIALRDRIGSHFHRKSCSYGHRSIRDELRKEGDSVGRKKGLRLMEEDSLVPTPYRPNPYGKASGNEHHVAKIRLDRDIGITRSNRVWTTDITYRLLNLCGMRVAGQRTGQFSINAGDRGTGIINLSTCVESL